MQHRVTSVAQHRFLDVQICLEVAETSRNAYRSCDEWWVSTMTADAFVREVQARQGDEEANRAIRQREIAKLRR